MPVSDDQWRASVGAINAGHSRALARLSCPVKRSAWKEDVLRLLWCLLVMAVCGGICLALKGRAVVGKAAGLVRRKDPKEWLFLVVVAVAYNEQLISLSRQASPPIRPGFYSLYERPGSGCGGYLSVVFYLAVLRALLLLSGDVETNPGPLFSLTTSNLNQLCELLAEVRDWNHLRIRLGVHEYCSNLKTTLECWLINNPNPTWTKLASALREMRHVTLANRILSTQDLGRQGSVMSQDASLPNSSSTHSLAATSSVSLPLQTKSWEQTQATGVESSQISSVATPTPIPYVSNTEQEVFVSRNPMALPPNNVKQDSSLMSQQQMMATQQPLFRSLQVMRNTEVVVWRGLMQIVDDQKHMSNPTLPCEVSSDNEQTNRELQLQNWLQTISMSTWLNYVFVNYLRSKPWREVKRVTFQFSSAYLQFSAVFRQIMGIGDNITPQIGGVVRVAVGGPVTHLVLVWDKRANKFLGLVPHDQSIIYENQFLLSVLPGQQLASLGDSMLRPPPLQQQPYLQPQPQRVGGDADWNWRSPGARKIVIQKLEEDMEGLSNPIEVEKAFFEKSRNKEEYMNYFRNVVLSSRRARQGDTPRRNQAAMMGAGLGQSVTGDSGSANLPYHDNSNDDNVIDRESQENAKKLFFEAMEKGYVTSQSIVIILIGIAGSGKSSFKRVVLNQPPEEKRVSTALTDATIRNISISRAIVEGSESVDWEVVKPEELLTMVADAIKKVVPQQSKDNDNAIHAEPDLNRTSANSSTAEPIPVPSEGSNGSFGEKSAVSGTHSEEAPTDQDVSEEIELDDSIIHLISKSQGSEKSLLDVHWVYVIDTGGQPQFLQLLPAFVKNISSCVCFVRLDQSLDDKPPILFFDKEGQQCGDPYPSERTNLQVIESCVRTIHSRCCLNSESSPNFFVVGTHYDKYLKQPHPETIEMKNDCLIHELNPLLNENLIFYDAGEVEKLVFPLNCKDPEDYDRSVAAEFRKCVMARCHEPKVKIPIAWFVLEQHIRQYATNKKVAYVKKTTCLRIARNLKMSDEVFQAALDHLLRLNIFRSYSSLPELIFCDTQVILLKLTELVQHSFQLRRAVVRGTSGEEVNFKNEGVITLKFLSRFPKFYSDIFTPNCFLKILRELLAIADMQKEKYFLPSLLKELDEDKVNMYRCSSKSLSPLLLCIEGCLPNGLFTSLIASLKNDHNWYLSYSRSRPSCLYQNCVMFGIPGRIPGSITLIASFEYIEVHVACDFERELDGICAQVFADVRSSLEASWKVLYPGSLSFKPAFFCSSCIHSLASCYPSQRKHHANVSDQGAYETCSIYISCGSELSESKQRWLRNMHRTVSFVSQQPVLAASIVEQPHHLASNILTNVLEDASLSQNLQVENLTGVEAVHSIPNSHSSNLDQEFEHVIFSIPECNRPHLDQVLDWDNDGVDQDLIDVAKHMSNWEERLVVPLKLTQHDISDIKEKFHQKPELQRREALQKWKSASGLSASYRQLLRIFIEARCTDCIQELRRILIKKNPFPSRKRVGMQQSPEDGRKKRKFCTI